MTDPRPTPTDESDRLEKPKALLECEGDCSKYVSQITWHEYAGHRMSGVFARSQVKYALWKCPSCGVKRVWGAERVG